MLCIRIIQVNIALSILIDIMFKRILKYQILILSSVIFVTFFACESAEEAEMRIKVSALIQKKFEDHSFAFDPSNLPASGKVTDFYKAFNYQPLWVNDSSLTEKGQQLMTLLEGANAYGLSPSLYHVHEIQNLLKDSIIDAEIMLTNGFCLMTTHLQTGILEQIDSVIEFNNFKEDINFDHADLLYEISDGKPLDDIISEVQPQLWEYQQLQRGLSRFVSQYALDTVSVSIPKLKEDSTKCYDAAKRALLQIGFIDDATAQNDSLFLNSIKAFQLLNGLKDDGVVGKWTGRMLEKTNQERFFTAALSLEKWRWKVKDTIPDRYIWVNLPAYTLKFFNDHKLLRQHRVVVGAYGTQTPEFTAKMKRMVTNPFWYVPYSIASTEILTGIKKDTSYLERRGYKLFREGKEVNSKTVDWTEVGQTNFRYHVRQNGGGGNSLGKIKFLFPNEHAVYIHDTPSKSLFWNDVRAYSHGCVRLHEPFELAKAILKLDDSKVESDSIEPMIQRGVQRVIELNTPIDVFIEYYTSTGDSLGNITFYPDMYGRDEKYISIFRENLK